jgi:hypothetical protein
MSEISVHGSNRAATRRPYGVLTEGLERDQGEGVLHAGKGLDFAGDEMTDVGFFVEIALHEEVVLAGGRVDLR